MEGKSSGSAPVTSGVPQGTVLGPALFLIYINDLPSRAQHCTIRLFADDCIIQKTIRSHDDCHKLQQDITAIGQWERDWLMEFHPDKCHVLSIPVTEPLLHPYHLHNTCLQRPPDNTIQYLGVTIQSDLKWTSHIKNITSKASRTLGVIKRNVRVPDRAIRERAYKSLIRPQVEFASTLWDPPRNQNKTSKRLSSLYQQVDMVQRRSARYVCRRYHNTSSVKTMLDELAWPTLKSRRQNSRLCMMYKTVHGLVAIPFDQYLIPSQACTRGHDQKYLEIKARINSYRDSFLPRTIRDWNGTLSQAAVSSGTLAEFKSELTGQTQH